MGIDAVFTWVDGNDPDFQEARRRHAGFSPPAPLPQWRALSDYEGTIDTALGAISQAQVDGRFRDMQELRYALRSVDAFAPWIDRIHIVTNGQVPIWLDTTHPRIRIVTHDQIFPDPACLPVFNSNAIELNLHRIPDLSETFLYFNDDFFLGRPVSPNDFQTADGRPRLFVEKDRPLPLHMDDSQALMGHVWAYNHTLLEDRFGPAPRQMFAHTPQFYSKAQLAEMEALWPAECALTRQHKFRTPFDVAFRILYTYFLTAPGQADKLTNGVLTELEHGLDYIFAKLGDDRTPYPEDLAAIRRQRPMFFCINDEMQTGDPSLDQRLKTVMVDVLSGMFPSPSPFETPDHLPPAAMPLPAVDMPEDPPDGLGLMLERVDPGPGQAEATPVPGLIWADSDHAPTPWPPAGGVELYPDMRLSLTGNGTALLWLRQREAGAVVHPERGFSETRWLRMPLRGGETVTGQMVLDTLRRSRAYEARLLRYLDPVLQNSSADAMALFLQADRAIRAGRARHRDLWLLQQATDAGFDPFWAGHRRILACLQLGQLADIPEIVGEALDAQPLDWRVLFDLAGSLMALKRFVEAQTVLAGFHHHPRLWRQIATREAACLRAMGPTEGDLRWRLIDGLEGRDDQLRLWLEVMLTEGAPATALDWLDAAVSPPPATLTSEYYQTRFRLLLALGRDAEAETLLKRLTGPGADPTDVLALAQNLRWGNHAGLALKLVDGLCQIHVDFVPARLARASMEIGTGQDLTRTVASLRGFFPQHPDQRHAKICLLIEALLVQGSADAALIELKTVIDDTERLPRLTDVIHKVIDGAAHRFHWRPDPIPGAARLLRALRDHAPDHGALHLAWARAALATGNGSDMVQSALDQGLALGGDPARIAFDRLVLFGLHAATDSNRIPGQKKLSELVGLVAGDDTGPERIMALAGKQPDPHFKLALLGELCRTCPEFPPATLAWADQALRLGIGLETLPAALDRAQKAGGDAYQLHFIRFRLALRLGDEAAAEVACRAALKIRPITGPFETTLAEQRNPSEGLRDTLLALSQVAVP